MKTKKIHSKLMIGFMIKGIMLFYFAFFFLGKDMVVSLFSYNDVDCELYEEMTTEDSEEESEIDDTESENKFRKSERFGGQTRDLPCFQIKAWNNSLEYEGFQHEVQDPPPEHA